MFRGWMKRFKHKHVETVVVANEDATPKYETIVEQVDEDILQKFRDAAEMEVGLEKQMEALTKMYAKASILRQQAWDDLYEKYSLDKEKGYQVNHKTGEVKVQVN
jgi:hypothetical protein